jgi:hypothetical protein
MGQKKAKLIPEFLPIRPEENKEQAKEPYPAVAGILHPFLRHFLNFGFYGIWDSIKC